MLGIGSSRSKKHEAVPCVRKLWAPMQRENIWQFSRSIDVTATRPPPILHRNSARFLLIRRFKFAKTCSICGLKCFPFKVCALAQLLPVQRRGRCSEDITVNSKAVFWIFPFKFCLLFALWRLYYIECHISIDGLFILECSYSGNCLSAQLSGPSTTTDVSPWPLITCW